MAKKVEINIPVKCKVNGWKLSKATGFVAWLYVGKTRTKFLVQDSPFSETEKLLVHFASGYSMGSTTPVKVNNHRSYYRLTEREAAKITLEKLIELNGLAKVEELFKGPPVIN